ncbi:hypothetical protein [Alkalihalobacterium bogoriense]|uniref:hypothetical protein n=1 Tax=Alkalihalobacterium bogoriense TaxID=246272 RepID=UPI00047CD979|nr:hypothetical protein [Alkalihalobacterium bogoriense]
MQKQVNGLKDIYALLSNERKIGGIIETQFIRLRSGEEYKNAVITNVDMLGSTFYSLGFATSDGQHMIINVSEISVISAPVHKKIVDAHNLIYKKTKTAEKLKYLKRLYEVNEGSYTTIFLEEAKLIIDDIGYEAAKEHVDVSFITPPKKVYSIA